jgi:hypothetical protein
VKDILKSRKGSIKDAELPEGSPSWVDIVKGAQKNLPGYKTIKKLLTDSRFKK